MFGVMKQTQLIILIILVCYFNAVAQKRCLKKIEVIEFNSSDCFQNIPTYRLQNRIIKKDFINGLLKVNTNCIYILVQRQNMNYNGKCRCYLKIVKCGFADIGLF